MLEEMKLTEINTDISLLVHEKHLYDLKRKTEVEKY